MYAENYTKLRKDIKEDLNKYKDIIYLLFGRVNIVKISILINVICAVNAIPNRIPAVLLFVGTSNLILKLVWKGAGS